MGGLFNGGGGPVQSNFTLGDHVKMEFAALLNQVEPAAGGYDTWSNFTEYATMNMRDIVYDAMSMGNSGNTPFTGVAAVDPQSHLDIINERMADFQSVADAMDVRDFVDESITLATQLVDDNLLNTTQIDALVSAMDARTKARHLQSVSRVVDGLNFAMAGMTSTVADRIADMEFDRQQEVNDYELKLVYGDRQRRTEMVQFLAGNYLATLGVKIDLSKNAFAAATDAAKINISALQDQIDKDVENTTNEWLWDVQTIKHEFEALQVGSGMPMVPRSPTKAERLMQQISSSISFGAQAGAAFGSPAAGFLSGAGLLATNLLMNRMG